jgi:hypothetical protein
MQDCKGGGSGMRIFQNMKARSKFFFSFFWTTLKAISSRAIYIHGSGWNIQIYEWKGDYSSKNVHIHPRKSDIIPRLYSSLVISSIEKRQTYCQIFPQKIYILLLSEISPKKNTRPAHNEEGRPSHILIPSSPGLPNIIHGHEKIVKVGLGNLCEEECVRLMRMKSSLWGETYRWFIKIRSHKSRRF